jgi:hypothetical protein
MIIDFDWKIYKFMSFSSKMIFNENFLIKLLNTAHYNTEAIQQRLINLRNNQNFTKGWFDYIIWLQ